MSDGQPVKNTAEALFLLSKKNPVAFFDPIFNEDLTTWP